MKTLNDHIVGTLVYNEGVWEKEEEFKSKDYNYNVKIELIDPKEEGITQQQQSYSSFLEKGKNQIDEILNCYLLNYIWGYEDLCKWMDITEDGEFAKKNINTQTIEECIEFLSLVIDRDGNYGWECSCGWKKDDSIAVLLSELTPLVITRDELRNLHKLNDNSFGILIHDGKKYWTTWDELPFFDEVVNVRVEVEGSVEEGVNAAQQKTYVDYLLHKSEYLKKLSDYLLPIYLGDKKRADEIIQSNQPVVVKTVLPKRLVIDKNGGWGWICYTNWDDNYIGVRIEADKMEILTEYQLRNLSQEKTIEDEVCGKLYIDPMFGCKTEIVRLLGGIKTTNVAFRLVKGNVTNQQRASYEKYQNLDAKFWESIKDEMLEYYLSLYDDLKDYIDIPESLEKDKVTRDSVMSIVTFKELYFSNDGMAGWLCESPTDEEDGIAFEFSEGKINLIPQSEIF